MSDADKQSDTPFSEEPTGGRILLAVLFVVALGMLAIIRWQTVRGETGQTAMAGGWWAEPALAPAIALVLTILSAAAAFFAAKREAVNISEAAKTYGQIALIAGTMIGAVLLMKILGFALSILIFATVAAIIGGFRGWRLVAISVLATAAMVLVFRVVFKIWFPRPELFKLIDLPIWLQGIL
jgi:hypothetical protein